MKRDILYVDDELDNLVVFEAAFEDDFNVLSARGAAEALDILERTPVPVVISDQRMPEMTGIELFQVMRIRHPHIQRVILTGYTDPEAMVDAINAGSVFHFMHKPWRRESLRTIILRAVEAHDMAVSNTALTDQLVASERSALLGRAAARIAHEMSNQLCIVPLVDYIESEFKDHRELVEMAGFARVTFERLADLVREVKAFIRLEHEGFQQQPLPLAETVRELAAFLRFDKSIPRGRLEVDVRAEPVVRGHRVKLQQVLTNLIHNAVHAVREQPEGCVRVTVDANDAEALVQVADNGCGIPPELLPRIWEPHFTTKGPEGNGLGLDICRRLVESHDGAITCESRPGAGTTFTVRLPLVADAEDQPGPAADELFPARTVCV